MLARVTQRLNRLRPGLGNRLLWLPWHRAKHRLIACLMCELMCELTPFLLSELLGHCSSGVMPSRNVGSCATRPKLGRLGKWLMNFVVRRLCRHLIRNC